MNIATQHFATIGIALLSAVVLSLGCGDIPAPQQAEGAIASDASALVTPKLVVVGHRSLPEDVSVDDFELDVGELRLLETDPHFDDVDDQSGSAMAAMMVTLDEKESSSDHDGGDDHGNPLPLPVEPDDGSEDEDSEREWLPMAAIGEQSCDSEMDSDGAAGAQRPIITFDIGDWYDGTGDDRGEVYGSTADEKFQINDDAIADHSSVIIPGNVDK